MRLAPGEKIIFQGHPSWRSALAFYFKGLVVVILAGAITAGLTRVITDKEVKWEWVIVVSLLLLVAVLLTGYIIRQITTYTVTNERLYIQKRFFSKSEQETRLQRVQNVNTHQSVIQRLLAIGDVSFDTAGGEYYDFRFNGVATPQNVVEAVHHAQREASASSEQPSQEKSDRDSPEI